MAFKDIELAELQLNPFTKIGKEWMLVTAGDEASHNTMTASWGGMGVLWGKNVAFAFIRPQRYTKQSVDANDTFTLTFFDESYRDALQLLGTKSGRDSDKIAEAGLTPLYVDGTTSFEEADLNLVCRKLYAQDMDASAFVDTGLRDKVYPDGDLHTSYVGAIERVLVRA